MFDEEQQLYDDSLLEVEKLSSENSKLVSELLVLTSKTQLEKIANDWNNKWKKNSITYSVSSKLTADVRNLIFNKSHILDKLSKSKQKQTHDDTALGMLKYVKKRLTYVGDFVTHKQAEYWQTPEETYQTKKGDCEDGALLLASMMLIAGVPSYRVKVCCGFVENPSNKKKQVGHAYVIYLADDDQWYVLDWCYWYNESVKSFKKVPHNDMKKYKDIWWTFNNEYSWAQKSTLI